MAVLPTGGRPQVVTALREAYATSGLADPQHVIEDMGWAGLTQNPYAYATAKDFAPQDRKLSVTRSRYSWRTFPLAKQAVRLFCTYVLGRGVTLHHADDTAQQVLTDFWNDYDNQIAFTSPKAMSMAMTNQRIDGELFVALMTDADTGRVKVRLIDPLQVEEIITDADDETRSLYYQRKWMPRTFQYGDSPSTAAYTATGEQRVDYFADVANAELPNKPPQLQNARIIHDKINALGQRGISDLYASLDWIEAHRNFMEDRATVTRAWASVAWKMKIKGGPPQVSAAGMAQRSSLSQPSGLTTGWEKNPPTTAASTFVANNGADLTPMTVDTGGPNAEIDGRMLVTQVGAGVGIMLHYFGDGGDANLATATAMDLPMQKLFEDGQTQWGGLIERVCQFVLVQAVHAGMLPGWTVEVQDNIEIPTPTDPDKTQLDSDFPLIVQRDTLALTQSMVAMKQEGFISTATGAKQSATLLGLDDIDAAVDEALVEKQEAQAQAMQMMQMKRAPASISPPAPGAAAPASPPAPNQPTPPRSPKNNATTRS